MTDMTSAMMEWLEAEIESADANINQTCAKVADTTSVTRNLILADLVAKIASRTQMVTALGELKYGEKTAADFPGYELMMNLDK